MPPFSLSHTARFARDLDRNFLTIGIAAKRRRATTPTGCSGGECPTELHVSGAVHVYLQSDAVAVTNIGGPENRGPPAGYPFQLEPWATPSIVRNGSMLSILLIRNDRIIEVDFLSRTCAVDPHFESILI